MYKLNKGGAGLISISYATPRGYIRAGDCTIFQTQTCSTKRFAQIPNMPALQKLTSGNPGDSSPAYYTNLT